MDNTVRYVPIKYSAIALAEIKYSLWGLLLCTLSLALFVLFIDSCTFQEVSDGQVKVTCSCSLVVACDCIRILVT